MAPPGWEVIDRSSRPPPQVVVEQERPAAGVEPERLVEVRRTTATGRTPVAEIRASGRSSPGVEVGDAALLPRREPAAGGTLPAPPQIGLLTRRPQALGGAHWKSVLVARGPVEAMMRPDDLAVGGEDEHGGAAAPGPAGGSPPSTAGVVVCGVDDSPAGRRALEWAVADAARRGARVRAVACWSGYGMEAVGMVSSAEECEHESRKRLEDAVERIRASVPDAPEVECLVVQDRPSRALVAASLDADLLVLGSHGHRAMHDWTAGSTSQRVLHHAVCPVVVVPDPRCVAKARRQLHAEEQGVPGTTAAAAGQTPAPV